MYFRICWNQVSIASFGKSDKNICKKCEFELKERDCEEENVNLRFQNWQFVVSLSATVKINDFFSELFHKQFKFQLFKQPEVSWFFFPLNAALRLNGFPFSFCYYSIKIYSTHIMVEKLYLLSIGFVDILFWRKLFLSYKYSRRNSL